MKLTIRRVGNSLGVIIPKAVLERWGASEGAELELDDDGIRPPRRAVSKADLDELRLERSRLIVRQFTPREIRAKGLANLRRWKAAGSWGRVYDEWEAILRDPDDACLYEAMLGRDERAMRLRQSVPYVGLLPAEVVREMNEKVAG
jgi:antitoxin component of MazEF toxin-antitoxin module